MAMELILHFLPKMQPIEQLIWQYNNADFKALQSADWSACFKQGNINGVCLKWKTSSLIFRHETNHFASTAVSMVCLFVDSASQ